MDSNSGDKKISIQLTLREKELICNVLSVEPEIVKRLKLAIYEMNSVKISLDAEELDVLLGAIAADANHAKNKKVERELNKLFSRVDEFFRKNFSED